MTLTTDRKLKELKSWIKELIRRDSLSEKKASRVRAYAAAAYYKRGADVLRVVLHKISLLED